MGVWLTQLEEALLKKDLGEGVALRSGLTASAMGSVLRQRGKLITLLLALLGFFLLRLYAYSSSDAPAPVESVTLLQVLAHVLTSRFHCMPLRSSCGSVGRTAVLARPVGTRSSRTQGAGYYQCCPH